MESDFEWDPAKDAENQRKHGVTFFEAQHAFLDLHRVIAEDLEHGGSERRFYCFGRVTGGILTVRFTIRGHAIRIFGAGYWRRGRRAYEEEAKIYR
jgi:uncharacterized DUF497 family protein